MTDRTMAKDLVIDDYLTLKCAFRTAAPYTKSVHDREFERESEKRVQPPPGVIDDTSFLLM